MKKQRKDQLGFRNASNMLILDCACIFHILNSLQINPNHIGHSNHTLQTHTHARTGVHTQLDINNIYNAQCKN